MNTKAKMIRAIWYFECLITIENALGQSCLKVLFLQGQTILLKKMKERLLIRKTKKECFILLCKQLKTALTQSQLHKEQQRLPSYNTVNLLMYR